MKYVFLNKEIMFTCNMVTLILKIYESWYSRKWNKMATSYRNSSAIYHIHHTMFTKKFASSKYPKFFGTLGYFTSTILLLVALLPHSGKFFIYLFTRYNIVFFKNNLLECRKTLHRGLKIPWRIGLCKHKIHIPLMRCWHRYGFLASPWTIYCAKSNLLLWGPTKFERNLD